ncbi:hypothetical protein LTR36_001886 [Oleoguttula mirabilis]|uniref:Uncharacterized protein n=1 Tax=Oleoguttula mirabilis TaxID=1507867 RepID=A0AAV9JNS6_9PEZI|nr:hypothetical protein LTR36_001886 [Oleoguttula mirabilis]
MLQRTLGRSLPIPSTPPPVLQCTICTCRCGTVLRSNGPRTEQRRTKGGLSARRAPTTLRQAQRMEPLPLSPAQVRLRDEAAERDKSKHYRSIQQLYADGQVSMTPDAGVEFLNEFATLTAGVKGKNVVDVAKFKGLVKEYELGARDLWALAFMLLRWVEEDRALGKKLLFTLSAAGHEEATMRILNHALLGNKTQPNLLRSSEVLYARGHLREIARKGENYRAMVLEGKIAYELGDDDYAIQMWEQAMDASVAVSEEEASLKAQGTTKTTELRALHRRTERDLSELSSPWIELTMIHYERYARHWQRNGFALALAEREKARKANEIGCGQDDPTSHYHAAEFFKDYNNDGSVKHTSSWLYHMTKAAATSHVKAAHGLAEFYASSGWKYIEDEPPDHVKPTPFDSYPAPSSTTGSESNNLSSWRSLLGLDVSAPVQLDPKESMFNTAAFPSTPIARWKLAIRWLEPAIAYMYAPSYLLTAKMLLEKDLWGQAHAPGAALKLSPDRYTFASKEDYEANRPIERPAEPVRPDEPNPAYSPSEAQDWLRNIFYAAEACKRRQEYLRHAQAVIRKEHITSGEAEDFADHLPEDVSVHVRKWLQFPYVREMWEGDIDGLLKEAKEICEREGWDMYNEVGGLMYRHGLGQQRGGDTPPVTLASAMARSGR